MTDTPALPDVVSARLAILAQELSMKAFGPLSAAEEIGAALRQAWLDGRAALLQCGSEPEVPDGQIARLALGLDPEMRTVLLAFGAAAYGEGGQAERKPRTEWTFAPDGMWELWSREAGVSAPVLRVPEHLFWSCCRMGMFRDTPNAHGWGETALTRQLYLALLKSPEAPYDPIGSVADQPALRRDLKEALIVSMRLRELGDAAWGQDTAVLEGLGYIRVGERGEARTCIRKQPWHDPDDLRWFICPKGSREEGHLPLEENELQVLLGLCLVVEIEPRAAGLAPVYVPSVAARERYIGLLDLSRRSPSSPRRGSR